MNKALTMAVLLTACCGCYTEYVFSPDYIKGKKYSEGGEIVEHYQTQNYGWYLFDSIPLVTGDIKAGHMSFMTFFSDQVRTDLLTEQFNKHLRKTNLRPVSVATLNTDWVTFEIPGLAIPAILPYIICYREVQISALLLKKEEAENAPAK